MITISEDQWRDLIWVLSSYANYLRLEYQDPDADEKVKYIHDLVEDIENSQTEFGIHFELDEGIDDDE